MHKYGVVPLLLVALAPLTAVQAQDGVAHRPGPGDPLPPFKLDAPGTTRIETGPHGKRLHIEGGVTFTMGDLRLHADTLDVEPDTFSLKATGNVILTRGDESIHGSAFVLDGENGYLTAENGAVLSPPLSVQGSLVTRTPTEIRATDARVGVGGTDGRGELQLRVGELRVTPDNTDNASRSLHVRNAMVSLYGLRLFTLRRATIRIIDDSGRRGNANPASDFPPVTLRSSRISGYLVGVGLPLTVGPGTFARAEVDASTRQGIQYEMSLRRTLVGGLPGEEKRGYAGVTPGGIDPSVADLSPLRQILKARPLPPAPDPVLDFDEILSSRDLLANPTRAAGRDLNAQINLTGNQEIGFRRQGPLLLSRQPEFVLSGQLPFSRPVPVRDNTLARAALHQVRLYATGEANTGYYDETRLASGRAHVREGRFGGSLSIGTLPLLLGEHTLTEADISYRAFGYRNHQHYDYIESRVSAAYIFGWRTSLGLTYIARDTGGATPFQWDQVDTQNEAQVRGQIALGSQHKYTLAGLARYDVTQERLFDYETTLAVRGRNIEPRFTYRYLNRQFAVSFALPGLSL